MQVARGITKPFPPCRHRPEAEPGFVPRGERGSVDRPPPRRGEHIVAGPVLASPATGRRIRLATARPDSRRSGRQDPPVAAGDPLVRRVLARRSCGAVRARPPWRRAGAC